MNKSEDTANTSMATGSAIAPPPSDAPEDRRQHRRGKAHRQVDVRVFNYEGQDKQDRGAGYLEDTSVGGAWVINRQAEGAQPRPRKGEIVVLDLGRRVLLPGKVVRDDELGFAVQFDFSIDILREDFET